MDKLIITILGNALPLAFVSIGGLNLVFLAGCARNSPLPALHLVKVMELDRSFLVGGRGELAQSAPTISQRDNFLACTDKADLTNISTLIAARIKQTLDGNEIAGAIDFYESDAGKKYTRRDMEMGNAEALGKKPAEVEFSPRELSQIDRFTKSSAGVKLIANAQPFVDAVAHDISPLVHTVLVNCAVSIRNIENSTGSTDDGT